MRIHKNHTQSSPRHQSTNNMTQAQPLSNNVDFQTSVQKMSPENVLQLQSMIGNRAVMRMMQPQKSVTIQRRFESGTDFKSNTTDTNVYINAMADLMDRYNTYLDKDPKTATDYGDAAGILKALERKIFEWSDANNGAYEKLSDIPHYAQVEALRVQAGKEHEDFVADSMAKDGTLPFDFGGMDKKEGFALIMLWNRIKAGAGKIKVVGDPAYKKRIYSWLVKLLETPTGRELLSYLNAGDPNELMTNIYIGQTKDQLPGTVEATAKTKGKEIEDRGVSEAQPLGATGELIGPSDVTGAENPKDYMTATSTMDFRTAMMEGKKGVIFNGKKYEFNTDKTKHVGAFVTAHEGASKNESDVHHQIMTPGWVTMGHELGHAAHFKGGSTSMVNPDIMKDVTGKSEDELNMIWQNSEELMTITNWENSLRSDVGLTERASHIPYDAGKKVERYFTIINDMKATHNDFFYNLVPSIADFKRDLKAAFNSKDVSVNLQNNGVYNTLRQRWLQLKVAVTADDVKAVKRQQLLPIYNKLTTKYATKSREYRKTFFVSKSKKRDWAALQVRYNQLKDKYDNHLDEQIAVGPDSPFGTFKNAMDDAQFDIGKISF